MNFFHFEIRKSLSHDASVISPTYFFMEIEICCTYFENDYAILQDTNFFTPFKWILIDNDNYHLVFFYGVQRNLQNIYADFYFILCLYCLWVMHMYGYTPPTFFEFDHKRKKKLISVVPETFQK